MTSEHRFSTGVAVIVACCAGIPTVLGTLLVALGEAGAINMVVGAGLLFIVGEALAIAARIAERPARRPPRDEILSGSSLNLETFKRNFEQSARAAGYTTDDLAWLADNGWRPDVDLAGRIRREASR